MTALMTDSGLTPVQIGPREVTLSASAAKRIRTMNTQAGTDPRRPLLPLGRRAGVDHRRAQAPGRVVIGGEEALVLAVEVLVEVRLRDRRAPADHRHRGLLVADLVEGEDQRRDQPLALVARDELG